MSARLIVRDEGAVIIIDVYGKLASGEGRHSLHAQLRKLAGSGRFRVLLNVAGVPSLDSDDIGELMAGHAAVTLAGGELKLLSPRAGVDDVLRTTGISQMIDTFSSEESALRSFTPAQRPRFRLATSLEPRSEWYYG